MRCSPGGLLLLLAPMLCGPAAGQAGDRPTDQAGRGSGTQWDPPGTGLPAGLSLAERVQLGIDGGVDWLLANQREDGAWGSHQSPRPIEVLADVPGSHDTFRVATTSIALTALVESPVPSDAVDAAIDRGIEHLLANWDVKRPDLMEHYSVWAFGYGLEAVGRLLVLRPDHPRAGELRELGDRFALKLGEYQDLDGGWGYLSLDGLRTAKPSWTSMSFTTATCLVGLDSARSAGIEVPEAMIDRAVRQVLSCKTPLGVYTYGKLWNRSPASEINLVPGAACRTPLCNHAVELFGRTIPEEEHVRSLDDLLRRHARFQAVSLRRPIPHESWFAVSGYFYLYGHAGAAYVLEQRSPEVRRRFSPALAEAVLLTRQPDGSFWDYTLYSYHKPYGTAFALLALHRVELEGEELDR